MQNNKQNLVHQSSWQEYFTQPQGTNSSSGATNSTNIIRTLTIKVNTTPNNTKNLTLQTNQISLLFGSVSNPITVQKIQSLLTKTHPQTK